MVLRGAQIHQCGQASCSLLFSQSLPHNLAWLYGRAGLFTSTDLVGIEGPCLEEVQIWTDSHGSKSFSETRNQLPDAEETFYVSGHCTDRPDDVHLDRRDVEKPEQSSDEQDHWEAALRQDVDRPTASPRLQQKRTCIMCEKACPHTYVFRSPNGGAYDL